MNKLSTLGKLCLVPALLVSTTASADTVLGLYAEVNYWSATLDGDFGNGNSNGLLDSFQGENGDRDQHPIFSASFEHMIPLIPNVMLRQNNINYADARNLTNNVDIGSATFDTSSPVAYNFDFSHTDIVLYYEILDNWVNLDVGLAAKKVQFEFDVRQGTEVFHYENDETIPMLYGKAAFELPFSGWQVTAEGMALTFEDDSIEDISIELGYNFNSFAQVNLGYRQMVIDIERPGASGDSELTLDGTYIGFIAHL